MAATVFKHVQGVTHSAELEVCLACPQCHADRVAEILGRQADPQIVPLTQWPQRVTEYLRQSVERAARKGPLSTSTATESFKFHAQVRAIRYYDGGTEVELVTGDLGVADLVTALLEDKNLTVSVGPADTTPLGA